jgi:flagellar basal-body rod protein FlgC
MTNPLGFLPQGVQPLVRPMFRTLSIASSGLSAQRVRMETIASNIANAETTHTEAGGPYKRKVVELQGAPMKSFVDTFAAAAGIAPAVPASPASPFGEVPDDHNAGVTVKSIGEDMSDGPLVYDPSHPDADDTGYVRYPNVRVTDEIVDLMDARRNYEANATVFQSAKAMLRNALDI